MPLDILLVTIAVLLGLSLLASLAGSRFGLPSLPLFVAVGMLAGSDGPGGIWFDDAALAQSIGFVGLAFILFSGGLDTEWKTTRPQLAPALALSTAGVAATAAIVATICVLALGFSWLEGLLLGSIVASTDAAAVFATLRAKGITLPPRVKAILELESGSNDPAAIFLTVTVLALLTAGPQTPAQILQSFAWQFTIGGAAGYAVGRLGVVVYRRLRFEFEALYSVFSLVLALVAFSGTNLLGGNGFLAVYIAGIALGQGQFHQKKGLRRFHDALAWLMQISLFLVLGLLVFPSQLPEVATKGLVLAFTLLLLARPVAVHLCLVPFRVPYREQAVIAWTGLRGAVPIVLATYPLLAGYPRAELFFHLVFFVVITSMLLQGTLLPFITRQILHLESTETKTTG